MWLPRKKYFCILENKIANLLQSSTLKTDVLDIQKTDVLDSEKFATNNNKEIILNNKNKKKQLPDTTEKKEFFSAGIENIDSEIKNSSDLEENISEEKKLPTPNPLPISQEVENVIRWIKEWCEHVWYAYNPGKQERNFAKHISSKAMLERIQQYWMDLENFIKNVIKTSKAPYAPRVNSPMDFYYNRPNAINNAKKYKENNEMNKKKIVVLQ